MGMSATRKAWRKFKDVYPEFDKARTAKFEMGPELDRLVKAVEGWSKAEASLTKYTDAVEESSKRLTVALNEAAKIVKKSSNGRMNTDYFTFDTDSRETLKALQTAIISARRHQDALAKLSA
jgi:hypothetical protein